MLFFKGTAAYSEFQLQRILQQLMQQSSLVKSVDAHFGYFVDTADTLDRSAIAQLTRLLPHSEAATLKPFKKQLSLWVVPRLGTISPWSSKATDIAHICGLKSVVRIERGVCYHIKGIEHQNQWSDEMAPLLSTLYDPMTESVILDQSDLDKIFIHEQPRGLAKIDLLAQGIDALTKANDSLGLALSSRDMRYLFDAFRQLNRNPTESELMMFAQVNSEHCRHKIFNAKWLIDGKEQPNSLFAMIRHTYQENPENVLVAYEDNAAVLQGGFSKRWLIDPKSKKYHIQQEAAPIVLKVETHNHPTAISPFPGAATGNGGEIRDEAATGRGAYPKAGLTGYSVSHLNIPNFSQPWEINLGKPKHIASALDIMLQAPIGGASFNNEFGRPNLCGYFRSLEIKVHGDYGDAYRGYHKPIMIAGGIGNIRPNLIKKKSLPPNTNLIVLGGPAMRIGLGGGSASSRASSEDSVELEFASVQRSNPEMQRRCQEVINHCWSLGEKNPILSIHDVGAGGLSNALPEIVAASERGAEINLRAIPNAEPGMSPLEIWCNEAQERFVLAVSKEDLTRFELMAKRERCPFAVVGRVSEQAQIELIDTQFNSKPVDMSLSLLFEENPALKCQVERVTNKQELFDVKKINLADAIKRVLQFPAVADKSFLITIGDRSVTGLVMRDQMVGPWQVPVADVAVTCNDYQGYVGEALAMGERAPIALLHPAASARMAVGEAITNIAAAAINNISDITLSANWMAAVNYLDEGAGLYDAVQAIAMELCPALGISIPVGKDSLSMYSEWRENGEQKSVTAPLSLVISAAAIARDVRKTLTPQLQSYAEKTQLVLLDLGKGANSMGGSVLAQTDQKLGQRPPDVDDPQLLKNFFQAIQALNQRNLILAYHDRSDGGLLATLCEMMFAGHMGINIYLEDLGDDPIRILFNEELGAVIQVRSMDITPVMAILGRYHLLNCTHMIGSHNQLDKLCIHMHEQLIYSESRVALHRMWSETSYRMQALRDNPDCAKEEYDRLLDQNDPGLRVQPTYNLEDDRAAPYINTAKPRVAILREQGVNGHMEMAAAFSRVHFECVDVHMSDLLSGDVRLDDFKGLVACGGFSYGDVLGAGRGWAQSILMHESVSDQFREFFASDNTFALGVCNGCQMLAELKALIPGTTFWPNFTTNLSQQFEARVCLVEVRPSPSIFFKDMVGSYLPITVAHVEGHVGFEHSRYETKVQKKNLVTLQYVDHYFKPTQRYPFNPNGSVAGITGFTNTDGRVTILMPHPERVFRTVQNSWHPKDWGERGAWFKFFENARLWVG